MLCVSLSGDDLGATVFLYPEFPSPNTQLFKKFQDAGCVDCVGSQKSVEIMVFFICFSLAPFK